MLESTIGLGDEYSVYKSSYFLCLLFVISILMLAFVI
jgi:hypothetical protein